MREKKSCLRSEDVIHVGRKGRKAGGHRGGLGQRHESVDSVTERRKLRSTSGPMDCLVVEDK